MGALPKSIIQDLKAVEKLQNNLIHFHESVASEYWSSYEGAQPSRLHKYGDVALSAEDNELTWEIRKFLIGQCRYLVRNAPLFSGSIETHKALLLGDGYIALPQTNNEEFNDFLYDRFQEWSQSCEIKDRSLQECVEIRHEELLIAGDHGTVALINNGVLELQLLDPLQIAPHYLSTDFSNLEQINTRRRDIQGVRVDASGRPTGYYVYSRDDFGRFHSDRFISKDRLYFSALFKRSAQTRGIPPLANVISDMLDHKMILQAEKAAQSIASMLAAWIESPEGGLTPGIGNEDPCIEEEEGGSEGGEGGEGEETVIEEEHENYSLMDFTEGMIPNLRNGEEFKIFESKRPNSNWFNFLTLLTDMLSSSIGMSRSLIMQDFTANNFSQTKSLIDTFNRRNIKYHREHKKFLNWVYNKWLFIEVASGRIQVPSDVGREDLFKVDFYHPKRFEIDPSVALSNDIEEIRSGFTTYRRILLQRGIVPNRFYKELQKEKQMFEIMGISHLNPSVSVNTESSQGESSEE